MEEAELIFHDLSKSDALDLMGEMEEIRNEQKLDVSFKEVDDLFLNATFPILETIDFKNNGMIGTIQFVG